MTIQEITDKTTWNTWLLRASPNTFLQSWEWGQIQQSDGETAHYLGVFDGAKQVGAALVTVVHARRGTFLLCPHGPIVEGAPVGEVLSALVQHCRKLAVQERAVAIRIAPLLEESDALTSMFSELGFHPAPLHIHAELTWIRDISIGEQEILNDMRKTTRHAIRKAEQAGVEVTISTDPGETSRFYALYEKTRARHQFTPFRKAFLENQAKIFSETDRMYWAFAKYQGKDVAAALLVQFGNTVFYHHGASVPLSSSVPAAQLLQWESMRCAKRRGATRYNFWGIAPSSQPRHPFSGITTFKKGFGGYAINYMHLQDLPTSPFYWRLWAVETYRRIKRGF